MFTVMFSAQITVLKLHKVEKNDHFMAYMKCFTVMKCLSLKTHFRIWAEYVEEHAKLG